MDVQLGLRCWVPEYKRLVCESNRKRQGALRAGAGSAGRDNDPGGLGYMPDSQGPNMAKSQYRDRCFGSPVIHHQASLSQGTHLGREIINGPCSLMISLPQVIPPLMWVYP